MFFFTLLFLVIIFLSGITTIPFSIGLLTVSAVVFKKIWVFFAAFGLGLFIDLILIRHLGYTSLVLTVFVFMLFLYERKFETQTLTFVSLATFIGSMAYLMIFKYDNILFQSLVSSLLGVLLFKMGISKIKSQNSKPNL